MKNAQDTSKPVTRILLAEDHQVVRNGIRLLLERQEDFEVIAEAEDGEQALAQLAEGVEPDVVITDINMPGIDGIELVGQLTVKIPKAKLIVLSMLDTDKFVSQAFKAGASAYLLKNVSADELIFAIKHVRSGGQYICSEIAMRCMKHMINAPQLPPGVTATELNLNEREVQVLHMIADGLTNQEIADKLFTSKRTVEGYRQQLMNRTGSRNTAALIKFAVSQGIIS